MPKKMPIQDGSDGKAQGKTVRLQYEVPLEFAAMMNEMQVEAGLSTGKQLLMEAVAHMRWMMQEAKKQRAVGSMKDPSALEHEFMSACLAHAMCCGRNT